MAKIVCDSEVMMGKPVVEGTRLTVENLLEKLAAGYSHDDLLQAHPRLTMDGIRAALDYAVFFWLVAFAAPAQAIQVLRAQEISKTSMKASLHTQSYPINNVDPSGLIPYPPAMANPRVGQIPSQVSGHLPAIAGAQAIVQRYSPGREIPLSSFQVNPLSLAMAAPLGGYAMETNTLDGSVNVNPAIFQMKGDTGLVLLVGALANETYHVRNPRIHGDQAERESAQLEEAVLLKWEKFVDSTCYVSRADQEAKVRLLGAIRGGIDQARSIITRYGGSPSY